MKENLDQMQKTMTCLTLRTSPQAVTALLEVVFLPPRWLQCPSTMEITRMDLIILIITMYNLLESHSYHHQDPSVCYKYPQSNLSLSARAQRHCTTFVCQFNYSDKRN